MNTPWSYDFALSHSYLFICLFFGVEFDLNFKLLQKKEFSIPDHLMIHDWAFTDSHYIIFGNRIKLDVPGNIISQQ